MQLDLKRFALSLLIPVVLFGLFACSLFDNSLSVTSEQVEAAAVSVNATQAFQVPVWCGERKEEFTMGDDFTLLEQYETEIEIVLPQKRILGFIPTLTSTATLVQKFTLTQPSNFQTPGEMTLPVHTEIDPAKTIRISCDEIKFLPTIVNEANNVIERLGEALSDSNFFHGVLTIETDSRDLRVFKNTITRSVKCVDQGSGLDCLESQLDRDRTEIEAGRVSLRQEVDLKAVTNLDVVVVTGFFANQFCPGDGSGGFTCSAITPVFNTGEGNFSAAKGDFNGDGNLDMVVVPDGALVQLCLGDGMGDFTCSAIALIINPSDGGSSTTSGDYNEDGHMDFFIVADLVNTQICLGDGTGMFACSVFNIFNYNMFGAGVVSGDFNDDDNLDTVIVMDDFEAQFCAGDGAGGFSCSALGAGTVFSATGFGMGAVAGDFNEDGALDFLAIPEGAPANLCAGDSTGSFTCSGIGRTFNSSNGLDAAPGDFDRDGHLDFVLSYGNVALEFCSGDGTGSFVCSIIPGLNFNTTIAITVLAGNFDAD